METILTSEVKTVAQTVVGRIKEILAEKHLSVYRLEKVTAIPHGTMQSLMRADYGSVNLKTILLICRGLGVTAAEFFASPRFDDPELEVD